MALVLPLVVAVALLAVLLLLVVVVVVVVFVVAAAAPGLPAAAADPGCFPSCTLLEEDRIDHKPL